MPTPAAGSALSTKEILLDSPTATPALGYDEIGRAFATIISQTEPRFAIGIFGGWGSGKTTLMNTIKRALSARELVVVDFNAWRFEREPQLLIPLLDTIRGALIHSSKQYDARRRKKVRSIATRVGRVVRALATGLSGQVGLPGTAKVSYDVGRALDAISHPGNPESAQSLYVAAFQELETAFSELSIDGVTRIVVFVDDLDRCLPSNALDLLESIKLFFDLPGFVFVVGLDEDIVERAIRAKFPDRDNQLAPQEGKPDTVTTLDSRQLSREYTKKIFQVPYSLPPILPSQLDDLLQSMCHNAAFGPSQMEDLQIRVRPYLEYLAKDRRVNPREVKRFINTYTIQTLVRPKLDPDTVLALQTLSFPYEWNMLYNAVRMDSGAFLKELQRYRQAKEDEQITFANLSPGASELPSDLAKFLRSTSAAPLLRHGSLDPYLSSLDSTSPKSGPPWPRSAQPSPSGTPPPPAPLPEELLKRMQAVVEAAQMQAAAEVERDR